MYRCIGYFYGPVILDGPPKILLFAPMRSLVVSAYLRVDPSDDLVTLVIQCVTLRQLGQTPATQCDR